MRKKGGEVFFPIFFLVQEENRPEGVMSLNEYRKRVAGQRKGEKSLVPNTKFKAPVLIPSRMDGVGVSACVYARMCVFVCAQLRYLATAKLNWEVTKRNAALGGSHGEASLFINRPEGGCHFLLSAVLVPSRVQGGTHTAS